MALAVPDTKDVRATTQHTAALIGIYIPANKYMLHSNKTCHNIYQVCRVHKNDSFHDARTHITGNSMTFWLWFYIGGWDIRGHLPGHLLRYIDRIEASKPYASPPVILALEVENCRYYLYTRSSTPTTSSVMWWVSLKQSYMQCVWCVSSAWARYISIVRGKSRSFHVDRG